MTRLSELCCLLLICSWYQLCNGNPFVVSIGLVERGLMLADAYSRFDSWLGKKPHEASNSDLLEKMEELSVGMEQMKSEILRKISQDLQDKVSIITTDFYLIIADIDKTYETFLEYVKNGDKYQKSTLEDFAKVSTSDAHDGIDKTLGRLHDLFVNKNHVQETFLSTVTKDTAAADIMCLKNQSKQQLINDLFEALVNSTVKGLLVTAYSYDVKAKYDDLSYDNEQARIEGLYLNRTKLAFEKVKQAYVHSSRAIWRCDPVEHVKDTTYSKLEQVFQGYFAYDKDLWNDESKEGTFFIYNNCDKAKNVRSWCKTDRCQAQHYTKWCRGNIRDCVDESRNFQICHADVDSDRRYEWMRKDQEKEQADYGVYNPHVCYSTQGMMTDQMEEYTDRWDDICTCNCESEDKKIDRYFSLEDVLSCPNKVVTGAKLSLDNHVFHIQIQQGTLGANGTIIDKPEWKDIRTISKAQLLAHNISKYAEDETLHWYKNDLVYSVTYNQSYVYLDTLEHENPERVVTGLRFQQVGDHLRLEIQTTPVDYATGKLDTAASSWTTNEKTKHERSEVKLTNPGSPAEIYDHSVISSKDQYVHFRMTDLVKDVGSWTVPFIDLQEVVTTYPPMPLAGAGLIHRGKKGSGGFLALKVLHYDYTRHL